MQQHYNAVHCSRQYIIAGVMLQYKRYCCSMLHCSAAGSMLPYNAVGSTLQFTEASTGSSRQLTDDRGCA